MLTRDQQVARVLWVVLWLNLAVAGLKLFWGWQAGALSLVADGVHSVLDASSNVVGLVGMALASRPADSNHPYGHRKLETLTALVIGLLIGAGFLELTHQVIAGLLGTREQPELSWPLVLTVVATVLVNVWISRFESRRGRELGSSVLEADAHHTRSDAFAASVVLLSLLGVYIQWPWADLLGAGIVSVIVGRTAIRILWGNLMVLTDEAQLDPQEVYQVAVSVPGVLGAHRIRSRGTPDHVYLDLHIHLPAAMTVTNAHDKTHEVVDALLSHFGPLVDVVIHMEPADGREKDRNSLAPGITRR